MEQKLDLILNKLEMLESGQKELNQIVRAIRDRQENTDAKLESLSMDVHNIRGVITSIKETQQILIQGQERQDKILESLALRSLEQETELRE
ncbi:hypothetical protein ACQYAD_09385 [Neobacillus sp. SM06]|uniref:hypothetical protein n=1 Tax=Neobacillus sp. SM06 TaxID=3422492 RepID=UPI003D2C9BF3